MESENIDNDDKFDCQTRDGFINSKNIPVLVPNNNVFCALLHVELVLLMSWQKRGGEVENLLQHAMSMMKNAIKDDHATDVEELAKKEINDKQKGATKLAKMENQSKHLCCKPET